MSKKYTFVLKNIDVAAIDTKYNIMVPVLMDTVSIPEHATKIDDITSIQAPQFDYFKITMYDSIIQKSIQKTCCFWDTEPFEGQPLGCPIKYVHKKMIIEYTSDVTKEKYTVVQNIPTVFEEKYNSIEDYYITDGCFCSVNCILAFILDNIHNPKYVKSEYLLYHMYKKIKCDSVGTIDATIHPAPSRRLLKKFGGSMDIQTFRENNIHINDEYYIKHIPRIVPIGAVFESVHIN